MPDRASLLTAMIVERRVCMPCLAMKLGTDDAGVEIELARINKVLEVQLEPEGRCRICLFTGPVISMLRPS
jgi:hypothetical protein